MAILVESYMKGIEAWAFSRDQAGGGDVAFMLRKLSGNGTMLVQTEIKYLFRLTFDISLRSAGPSSGFKSSNAHKRSSETL